MHARLFSQQQKPPKGFENFFNKKQDNKQPASNPKSEKDSEKDEQEKEAKDEEEPRKSDKKSKGKQPPRNIFINCSANPDAFEIYRLNFSFNLQTLLFLGIPVLYLFYMASSGSMSHEISWNEFRKEMLDKGLVDYLKVINSAYVKVFLRQDSHGSRNSLNQSYYFSIGSVESFERNLEAAQNELGIPSRERITVMYSNEVDKLNLFLNFAPILLLLGFLYFASGGVKGMRPGSGPGGIFNVGKSKGN